MPITQSHYTCPTSSARLAAIPTTLCHRVRRSQRLSVLGVPRVGGPWLPAASESATCDMLHAPRLLCSPAASPAAFPIPSSSPLQHARVRAGPREETCIHCRFLWCSTWLRTECPSRASAGDDAPVRSLSLSWAAFSMFACRRACVLYMSQNPSSHTVTLHHPALSQSARRRATCPHVAMRVVRTWRAYTQLAPALLRQAWPTPHTSTPRGLITPQSLCGA